MKYLRVLRHRIKKIGTKMTTPPPPLAIFQRHSLLDGFAGEYASNPGLRTAHPTLGQFPFNVGDHFVSLAVAKVLNVQEFYTLKHGAPQRYFDFVNENCRAFIVVSQNSLQTGFFGKYLPPNFLGKIKIPMIFLSLGVQFELDETPRLTKEDVESLKIIHDKCESSQVRGNISAQLLADHGIMNTRVLGCPSIIWSLDRNRKTATASNERIGWTITNMHDRPELDTKQHTSMQSLAEQTQNFVPITQGGEIVLQDYLSARDGLGFGNRQDEILDIEVGGEQQLSDREVFFSNPDIELVKHKLERPSIQELSDNVRWYYRHYSTPVVDAMLTNGFFSHEVASYMRNARSLSLMAGTRLHGNIMALSQGIPTIFYPHDQRTLEMAELFEAPMFGLGDKDIDLVDLNFEKFDKKYRELYDGFANFFEGNGLAHQL